MKTINFTRKKLILQNDKSEELMTKISGRQLWSWEGPPMAKRGVSGSY